jgi:hypothetical protein
MSDKSVLQAAIKDLKLERKGQLIMLKVAVDKQDWGSTAYWAERLERIDSALKWREKIVAKL